MQVEYPNCPRQGEFRGQPFQCLEVTCGTFEGARKFNSGITTHCEVRRGVDVVCAALFVYEQHHSRISGPRTSSMLIISRKRVTLLFFTGRTILVSNWSRRDLGTKSTVLALSLLTAEYQESSQAN